VLEKEKVLEVTTRHVSKDVYFELILSPTLFKSFVHLEVKEFDELLVEFDGDLSMVITKINKISLFLIFNFL
jgi:hypothetical protein